MYQNIIFWSDKMETIGKLQQANELAFTTLLSAVANERVHVEVAVWLLCKLCSLLVLCHCRVWFASTACRSLVGRQFCCFATLTKWSQSSWTRYFVDIGLHSATDFSPFVKCCYLIVFITQTGRTNTVVTMTFRRGQSGLSWLFFSIYAFVFRCVVVSFVLYVVWKA